MKILLLCISLFLMSCGNGYDDKIYIIKTPYETFEGTITHNSKDFMRGKRVDTGLDYEVNGSWGFTEKPLKAEK